MIRINNKIRTVMICMLVEAIMLTASACGIKQGPSAGNENQTVASGSTTAQSNTTARINTSAVENGTVNSGTQSSSVDGTESSGEGIESELAMIKEKAEKLPDIDGLVLVKDLDDSISIDLKYATKDNFTGKKIYPLDVCALQRETAVKLCAANLELKKKGLKLKVWDAYRPLYVQKIFWDIVKDNRFVADPATGGSIHNRGCAVDVTLVDEQGRELQMPTGFDDFTDKAYGDSKDLSDTVKENVKTLRTAMGRAGFFMLDTEWWHFEDENQNKYEVSDVKLEEFK